MMHFKVGTMSILIQRRVTVGTAVLFFISCAFPVVAAFVKDPQSWPKWWGVLDVGLAFVLVAMVCIIHTIARGRVDQCAQAASYRAYRMLLHGIIAMLLAFFLAGDRIIWTQCLTGFAWRTWLLLYALPFWFAAYRGRS